MRAAVTSTHLPPKCCHCKEGVLHSYNFLGLPVDSGGRAARGGIQGPRGRGNAPHRECLRPAITDLSPGAWEQRPYLSRMPQESMRRPLEFPSTPRWTEIRSTSWALTEMSLRQPWNPASGASQPDPEPGGRHPDCSEAGTRERHGVRTEAAASPALSQAPGTWAPLYLHHLGAENTRSAGMRGTEWEFR